MSTLLVALASFAGFIIAYNTYGRWLSRRIFNVSADAEVPSSQLQDDVDFVPTKREVIFGHHFTSIAGTGPIVGPAIAVFWGWLPALLWVVFGSIFIGAVHDFGALMVSLRNRGQTVGEVAGRLISPRAKLLFLIILFFALTIVLAIFGLVIASIFSIYPESVLSVWIEIPIAIVIAFLVHRRSGGLLIPSLLALALMYAAIYIGVYYLPIHLPASLPVSPVVAWTVILLIYCFFASVLPVWVLMQPRDYINSHQLVLALSLLVLGLMVASFTGTADLVASAPAVVPVDERPLDAPPIMPFLFITIACGAISGFHCLVSSGTSSKQIERETDAQYVGYGAMLLEGALAVIVILACCAGLGMGVPESGSDGLLTGRAAWESKYQSQIVTTVDASGQESTVGGWANYGLADKVSAFVQGGANFLSAIGIALPFGVGIVAVLVASFAATTLDTATRLQRYVVQELGVTMGIEALQNKYVATATALILAFVVAMIPGPKGIGTGGLILWPLFGATNQVLAGLALLVTVFYLWRRGKPVWFAAVPMLLMMVMPAWAMLWNLFNPQTGWLGLGAAPPNYLLVAFGLSIMGLQLWIFVEAILLWPKVKGVLEEALPPLTKPATASSQEPASSSPGR